MINGQIPARTVRRAATTAGGSCGPVIATTVEMIRRRHRGGGLLVDIGCGTASIWSSVQQLFAAYVGVDVIKHSGFPESLAFEELDLDSGTVPLADSTADVVTAIEVVEHVENPRAMFREMARLVRPSGWIIVTTPNQGSLLSLVSLLVRGHFDAFIDRPGCYPAHITALLEMDLRRIGTESGLENTCITFSNAGRVPILRGRWPSWLRGRLFSDNVIFCGRKPASPFNM